MNWKDSFDHFIFTQPGRNGVLLKYVIRYDQNPIVQTTVNYLDYYVD